LEHKRLNKLVYVSYNKKMTNRFQKNRELGCNGKRSNPLLLEEFRWDNEWVDENCGDGELPLEVLDEAIGASENLRGRNLTRVAATRATAAVQKTYTRNKKRRRGTSAAQDVSEGEEDGSDHDADAINEAQEDQDASDPVAPMEEDEDNHGCATDGDGGGFCLDAELLE
jgi:hypothetical protein